MTADLSRAQRFCPEDTDPENTLTIQTSTFGLTATYSETVSKPRLPMSYNPFHKAIIAKSNNNS